MIAINTIEITTIMITKKKALAVEEERRKTKTRME